MAKAYVQIEITNIEETKEKADELVETLGRAKELIKQLNGMDLIILQRLAEEESK